MALTAEAVEKQHETESLPAAIPDVPTYRFSVEQYQQLVAAGILEEDAPVELLEGWIVPKMTKNPPHDSALRNILHLLQKMISEEWDLHSQSVLTTGFSQPEPDVMVVRHDPNNYADRHPNPRDVALLIEVSEHSLGRDRNTKLKVYAACSIPEYWIINLINRRVEVYTQPSGPAAEPQYQAKRYFEANQELELRIPGMTTGKIAVNDILP